MKHWLIISLCAGLACAGAQRDVAESIRPGVNSAYLEEDSLALWVQRFEGDEREVVQYEAGILDALDLQPGMVVADVGAGTGLFIAGLSERVGDEGHVYVTEIVPAFLDRLRERAELEGLKNVQVIAADPRSPRLGAESVDLLFVCSVYHHIEFSDAYIPGLLEALRPGGELVVVDFEKIDGVTHPRTIEHVRASKEMVRGEVERAGFEFIDELEIGMRENYILRFRRPK